MDWIKNNRLTITFILIGAGVGFLYWDMWGCENGCTIKSNVYLMLLYGAFFGYFIGDFIQRIIIKRKQDVIEPKD